MPHTDVELLAQSEFKVGEKMDEQPIKQECEEIAEVAWNATKSIDDPEWGLTPTTHRDKFLYKAQSVKRSGVVDDDFDRKVAELLKPPKAKAAAVVLPIEPQKSETPKQGKLPEDFPALAALEDAKITTYAQLRKVKDLTSIPGVGPATAEKIAEALGETETVH